MNANECLSRALLHVAMFLEFSDDDVVDPDAAVAQMEQMAASLSSLGPPERTAFLAVCDKMVGEHATDPKRAKYLAAFGDTHGLT